MTDDRPKGIVALTRRQLGAVPPRVQSLRCYADPALSTVTPLGWAVLATAIAAWILAATLGWVEMLVIATACLLLFALCSLLTLGRTILSVAITIDPRRIVAGGSAAGQVSVTNRSKARLLPIALELPIGLASARFQLPSLGSRNGHEELFVVPTLHRGVIPVGPATTVRGDPLGLLRRTVAWTEVIELFVHPVSVPLEPLGYGLVRDLEGQTTNDVSMSDLDFHALREYAPGDDRRYIHWRSSAKASASTPGGKFLVRQFLDTRRSHVTVIIDGQIESYLDPEDFETAISVGASVAVRAIRDEMQTTVIAAASAVHEATVAVTLDGLSRAEFGAGPSLADIAAKGARMALDTSIAMIITGANTKLGDLQRAASHYPPEVNCLAMRIDPSTPVRISAAGRLTVLTLPSLSVLPALLRGVKMQ